jgi:hypothetical protein
MRAVVGLLTADGRRGTSVNGEFEAEDGKLDASAIETVPVRFDDCNDSLTGFRSNVKANNKVLFEFWKIAGAVPNVDIGANVGEGFRRMTNGGTELFEFEWTVVDIVAAIHGNITINGFGAPNFGRDFDDKNRRGWQGRRQDRSGRERQSRGEGERGSKRS